MKLSRFKLLIIAPSILITACGYGLKEVYNGVPYNSTNFFENYYNVWDKSINPYQEGNKITETRENKVLGEGEYFTSLDDVVFKNLDEHWGEYKYTYDKELPDEGKAFGPTVALKNYDDSFKYGVKSKMFDGQMFCNGDYANARTQVQSKNDGEDKGFGVLFSKECNDASYFMMNFKCSLVTESDQNLPSGYSNLNITVNFILKNNSGYTFVPVTCEVDKVPTNSGDQHFTPPFKERESMYKCFGFDVKSLSLSRLIGFTVQYEKLSDTISPTLLEKTYHAIMLYEVSFPYTTWN